MTLYPSTTPPQTTAIYGDFKKSTAISKGYNVGLRYIMCIVELWLGLSYRSASFAQSFVRYMHAVSRSRSRGDEIKLPPGEPGAGTEITIFGTVS